jgi:hypothetical protein
VSQRRVPVGPNVSAIEFRREGKDSGLVTLLLTERPGKTDVKWQTSIAAALGGDVR